MSDRRAWTLETARQIFPDVRRRTERAVTEVEAEIEGRADAPEGSTAWRDSEDRIQAHVLRWVHEMEALGVEVKGAWLVDFDCGSGCYCWQWPEPDLGHFHGYDDGFAGRVRIQ